MSCPSCAICMSPARTTASMAVVRNRGLDVTRLDALHHPNLHAAFWRALQLHVVHEVSNEEDAAAARLEQILRREWIGDRLGVEAFALIAHADQELRRLGPIGLELDEDALRRVVAVSRPCGG